MDVKITSCAYWVTFDLPEKLCTIEGYAKFNLNDSFDDILA